MNAHERKLVLESLKQRETQLLELAMKEKCRTKRGDDPYAAELTALADEHRALYDRLSTKEKSLTR